MLSCILFIYQLAHSIEHNNGGALNCAVIYNTGCQLMLTYMNEGRHDIDWQRDELWCAQLHPDEVLDQLIFFDGEWQDGRRNRNEYSVQVRIFNHHQIKWSSSWWCLPWWWEWFSSVTLEIEERLGEIVSASRTFLPLNKRTHSGKVSLNGTFCNLRRLCNLWSWLGDAIFLWSS